MIQSFSCADGYTIYFVDFKSLVPNIFLMKGFYLNLIHNELHVEVRKIIKKLIFHTILYAYTHIISMNRRAFNCT